MTIQAKITSSLLILALAGCASIKPYKAQNFDIKFGILEKHGSGNFAVQETQTIPYVLGENNQIFGYLMSPLNSSKYKNYAVLVMPENPLELEGEIESPIEEATTKGLRSKEVTASGPSIMDIWLTAGDPKGKYSIELFINGSLADSREFVVE